MENEAQQWQSFQVRSEHRLDKNQRSGGLAEDERIMDASFDF